MKNNNSIGSSWLKITVCSVLMSHASLLVAHGSSHHSNSHHLTEGKHQVEPNKKVKKFTDLSIDERFLLAKDAQKSHNFEHSLEILTTILQINPRHANSLLLHASVSNVVGNYPQAEQSCQKLFELSDMLIAIACKASIGMMTGKSDTAYKLLDTMLQSELQTASAEEPINEQGQWLYSLAAELAWSLGLHHKAEQYFQLANSLQTGKTVSSMQNYVMLTYSDFLLSTKKYQTVLEVLKPISSQADAKLRLVQASRALEVQGWKGEAVSLERYYDQEPKGHPHHREAAMSALLVLPLKGDSTSAKAKALKLAQFNWQQQKERIDAKLVLEAALLADQPEAAHAVLEWVRTYDIRDSVLSPLLAQILNSKKV